jgi:demethylmenaquinone methyltransferase / 2-methoxy-6-polyprenyl-1,4-benzoquinol methylase
VEKDYVRALFDSIAYRYDLLNHLLSGGIDLYWRRRAAERLRSLAPGRILDVATGTGDFAIACLRLHPKQIVGVDIAEAMLEHGRRKLRRRGLSGTITLRTGDAEMLGFESGSFDAVIAAFGVRNFENLNRGLQEMHRILRDGGRIVVLEFSRPRLFPFRQIYFFYFRRILPLIGRTVSKSRGAYTYLPESVLRFPEGDEFLEVLRAAGFRNPDQERLTFGIASIYTGTK